MTQRIDQTTNKQIDNVQNIKFIDKKTIVINVHNQTVPIILEAQPDNFGYDAGIYIVKE